ncbi:hypothetical protein [Paenibacillus sp. NPDC058071]|uniref:hypothetical protein n=1 Tax=Paenibacillus sp. NPDC058071 TaxID=3346326 RepID=UPI0036DC9CAA
MDQKIRRYYQLKQKQKDLEKELSELRGDIVRHCEEQGVAELETRTYRVKIVQQERKEFIDERLYDALPDPEMWRLVSKADAGKVASLIRLNVLPEAAIQDAYASKSVSLLHVDKK